MKERMVSIIIPCFNGERTLARCLNSVLTQTYQALEIVIIDDGSEDLTYEIAKSYQQKDSRVHVLQQPCNKGVSSSRNLGLKKATGEYIQFIDSDDEMLPQMVEALVTTLETENAQIAVCNFTGNPMFYTKFQDRVYHITEEVD